MDGRVPRRPLPLGASGPSRPGGARGRRLRGRPGTPGPCPSADPGHCGHPESRANALRQPPTRQRVPERRPHQRQRKWLPSQRRRWRAAASRARRRTRAYPATRRAGRRSRRPGAASRAMIGPSARCPRHGPRTAARGRPRAPVWCHPARSCSQRLPPWNGSPPTSTGRYPLTSGLCGAHQEGKTQLRCPPSLVLTFGVHCSTIASSHIAQAMSASFVRRCRTALVCNWQMRLSVTPSTRPMSARVRPSK